MDKGKKEEETLSTGDKHIIPALPAAIGVAAATACPHSPVNFCLLATVSNSIICCKTCFHSCVVASVSCREEVIREPHTHGKTGEWKMENGVNEQ